MITQSVFPSNLSAARVWCFELALGEAKKSHRFENLSPFIRLCREALAYPLLRSS